MSTRAAEPDTRPVGAASVRISPVWWLLAGYLAQVGVRLLLARGAATPILVPDEIGYLVDARRLAGGPGADLSGYTFYQGGYSLLVAPLYLLSHSSVTVYQLVLAVNALVGALAFPLSSMTLRRLGVPRVRAVPLAFAAALVPAAALYGSAALTDAVLPVVVLGWLLALDRFVRDGHLAYGVLASVLAVFSYTAHARGTVVLAVHLLVVAGHLFVRAVRRSAGLTLAAALGCAAGGWALNGWLRGQIWPHGQGDLDGLLGRRLGSVSGLGWTLCNGVGELWAMLVASWGLAGPGLLLCGLAVAGRRGGRADRIMAGAVLLTTLGIAFGSAASLQDEHRIGNYAYGRYLECLTLVFVLAGLAALLRERDPVRHLAVSAAMVVGGGLVVLAHLGSLANGHSYGYVPLDFPEVSLAGFGFQHLHLLRASVVVCVILTMLYLLGRWRPPLLFGALLVGNLLALAALTLVAMSTSFRQPLPLPAGVHGPIAVQLPVTQRTPWHYPKADRLYAFYAWRVAGGEVGRFDRRQAPPPGLCVAIVRWPKHTPAATSYPAHPASWRSVKVRRDLGRLRAVIWYDPQCRG